jgi:hypothetical protein
MLAHKSSHAQIAIAKSANDGVASLDCLSESAYVIELSTDNSETCVRRECIWPTDVRHNLMATFEKLGYDEQSGWTGGADDCNTHVENLQELV